MKLKLLFLVLALQTAWVLGTVFVQERALTRGQLVLLETRPVDPRDLLRGDYVILSYKISAVATNLFTPALTQSLPDGQPVFVLLERRGAFHEIARAATEPLALADGQVLLKGRTRYGWSPSPDVRLDYGLERYYVREGTGRPTGKLTVQAAVPASGQGLIRQVFVDGKPYIEAMKSML